MPIQPPTVPNPNQRGLYVPRLPNPSTMRSSFEPPPSLPGYYVDTEDDIVARDVPMDDSISYFPTRDLQKIFIRQWNKQGTRCEHLTYVLEQPDQQKNLPAPNAPPPPQQQELQMIAETLNSLNNGLAATFTQFGSILQGVQQTLAGFEKQIESIPRFTVDDGGQG